MFRAIVLVEEFSRNGWDSESWDYEKSFSALTKKEAIGLAKRYISENTTKSIGDFGITLNETKTSLLRVEEYIPEEIKWAHQL